MNEKQYFEYLMQRGYKPDIRDLFAKTTDKLQRQVGLRLCAANNNWSQQAQAAFAELEAWDE